MTMTPEEQAVFDEATRIIHKGHNLLKSVVPEEAIGSLSKSRLDDLLTLELALLLTIHRNGIEESKNTISIYLQTAYSFGFRDAQPIPDAFTDALDNPAPTAPAAASADTDGEADAS